MPEQERPRPVTETDKAADQMAQDILGGKIDSAGRKVVRKAIDHMDAEPVGKAKSDGALHRISRGGP